MTDAVAAEAGQGEASGESSMHIDAARAQTLVRNLNQVRATIQTVSDGRPVRLVAVSKLKPANDILALHQPPTSHLHFGENYLQELVEKATLLPRTVRWHFIGALQTNKCSRLAQIPNLFVVSGVDAQKKADALEKGRAQLLSSSSSKPEDDVDADAELERLGVHVQVNTSGEGSKSGVTPEETLELCRHINDACPHLRLRGLMTIGAIARSQATTPETENEDFVCLRETRDGVAKALGLQQSALELSMGMSQDFEGAIRMGSDEVRVGSTIFGERPPKKDAKLQEEVEQGSQ